MNYTESVFDEAPPVEIEEVEYDSYSSNLLEQNFPNPFNPAHGPTTISFNQLKENTVNISVYTVNGQCIKTLADGIFQEGRNMVYWDGTNLLGQAVSSGVYFTTFNQRRSH